MKRLVKFCHEHNIYEEVYYNIKHMTPYNFNIYLKILNGQVTVNSFFAAAFEWNQTKEGYKFWWDIHREWGNYCNIKNISLINETVN